MNAENTKNFLMVLDTQLAAEAASWQKVRQLVEAPGWQHNEQAAKALDLQKIKQTVEQAGKALVEYINRFASRLEQLGVRAQNAGTTAGDVNALEYGAAQTGLSNDAIAKAFQAIITKPGAEARLNKLGVSVRDASGQKKTDSDIFSEASSRLGAMPQEQARAMANSLGLAPDILAAMQKGLGKFIGDYNQLSDTLGVNMTQAVSGADHFMTARRKFDEVVELLQTNSSTRLNNGLGEIFDNFTKKLTDNAPDVERVLDGAVNLLLLLAEVGERVILRLIQAVADLSGWWDTLDENSQGLIATLGVMTAAWLALNSAFLLSPIGIVAMLVALLFSLYDSYKTWQEGGKTLIDWEQWAPGINAAKKALDGLQEAFIQLTSGTLDWKGGLQAVSDFVTGNWSAGMSAAVDKVKDDFNNFFTDITNKLTNSPIWRFMKKMAGETQATAADISLPGGVDPAGPLNPQHARMMDNLMAWSGSDSLTGALPFSVGGRLPWQSEMAQSRAESNVGIQQETNIYVQGSEPHLTAQKVAASQFDVNSQFVQTVRNMPV
ncbi:hypothetical protein [Erwinia sp.]|uniref:hypothetical protein n=1 Tax=Erwinia citreus TaxID=558 RepID=UPI00289A019B|nr:hypothetical protein [Erwinia sp.]